MRKVGRIHGEGRLLLQAHNPKGVKESVENEKQPENKRKERGAQKKSIRHPASLRRGLALSKAEAASKRQSAQKSLLGGRRGHFPHELLAKGEDLKTKKKAREKNLPQTGKEKNGPASGGREGSRAVIPSEKKKKGKEDFTRARMRGGGREKGRTGGLLPGRGGGSAVILRRGNLSNQK